MRKQPQRQATAVLCPSPLLSLDFSRGLNGEGQAGVLVLQAPRASGLLLQRALCEYTARSLGTVHCLVVFFSFAEPFLANQDLQIFCLRF